MLSTCNLESQKKYMGDNFVFRVSKVYRSQIARQIVGDKLKCLPWMPLNLAILKVIEAARSIDTTCLP